MIIEPEIISIRPRSRWAEDRIDARGVRRSYVWGPSNPHYYADELGIYHPIQIGRVEDAVSAKGVAMALRAANVVSTGLRKDGSPEKYLGLRPDDCQALNTESLEFTLVSVELDGKARKVELTAPRTLDAVTQDLGSIIIQSTRRGTRQMVPVSAPIKDFRIEFKLHLKGLTPFYRADLNEYWIYNDAGEFRFRIVRPEVIDPATGDPAIGPDETPLDKQVRHSLTDNPDGTWSYVKTPGAGFNPEAWPKIAWLDVDTVYSTTADGRIAISSKPTWAEVHDPTSGSVLQTGNTYTDYLGAARYIAPNYMCSRSFFFFDVSLYSGNAESAAVYICSRGDGPIRPNIMGQLGTQASPLVGGDYDSFSGNLYASVAWPNAYQYAVFNLPAQGISDLNSVIHSDIFKFCLREYDHDYLNVAPDADYRCSGMYTEYADITYDPYLEITWAAGGTTIPPTTITPTTPSPTTVTITTQQPTTIAPTTQRPITLPPTTIKPTTQQPTTSAPTSLPSTTQEPTTPLPTSLPPTTGAITTPTPTSPAPTTGVVTTSPPTSLPPTTEITTTLSPTTSLITSLAPTTAVPVIRRRGISNFGFSFRDKWRI